MEKEKENQHSYAPEQQVRNYKNRYLGSDDISSGFPNQTIGFTNLILF